eukprot:EG_transcript_50622
MHVRGRDQFGKEMGLPTGHCASRLQARETCLISSSLLPLFFAVGLLVLFGMLARQTVRGRGNFIFKLCSTIPTGLKRKESPQLKEVAPNTMMHCNSPPLCCAPSVAASVTLPAAIVEARE